MKAKKLVIVVVALLLIGACTFLIVNAAVESKNSSLNQVISNETEWKTGRMEDIVKKDLSMPLKDLPVYSFSKLSWYVGTRGLVVNTSSIGTSLQWFNDVSDTKVDNIQKVDDDHIAVVYRVAEEGYDEAYMFVMFERSIDETKSFESWNKTGEAYFFNDVHSIEDYSDVSVGYPVEKLYEIDKSIKYDVLRKEMSINTLRNLKPEDISNPDLAKSPRMIFKLLKDGILTIEYDLENMTVLEKSFYPYTAKELPDNVCVTTPELLNCLTNEDK